MTKLQIKCVTWAFNKQKLTINKKKFFKQILMLVIS